MEVPLARDIEAPESEEVGDVRGIETCLSIEVLVMF